MRQIEEGSRPAASTRRSSWQIEARAINCDVGVRPIVRGAIGIEPSAPRRCRCGRDRARRRAPARRRRTRRERNRESRDGATRRRRKIRRRRRRSRHCRASRDRAHSARQFLLDRERAPGVHFVRRRADLGSTSSTIGTGTATPRPAMRRRCAGVSVRVIGASSSATNSHHQLGRRIGIGALRAVAACGRKNRSARDRNCAARSSARANRRLRDRARPARSAGRPARAAAPRGAAVRRPASGS